MIYRASDPPHHVDHRSIKLFHPWCYPLCKIIANSWMASKLRLGVEAFTCMSNSHSYCKHISFGLCAFLFSGRYFSGMEKYHATKKYWAFLVFKFSFKHLIIIKDKQASVFLISKIIL